MYIIKTPSEEGAVKRLVQGRVDYCNLVCLPGTRVISPSYLTAAPAALSSNTLSFDDTYIISNRSINVNRL
jgi:hypothetical protein